jgi:hypothetical protein
MNWPGAPLDRTAHLLDRLDRLADDLLRLAQGSTVPTNAALMIAQLTAARASIAALCRADLAHLEQARRVLEAWEDNHERVRQQLLAWAGNPTLLACRPDKQLAQELTSLVDEVCAERKARRPDGKRE